MFGKILNKDKIIYMEFQPLEIKKEETSKLSQNLYILYENWNSPEIEEKDSSDCKRR